MLFFIHKLKRRAMIFDPNYNVYTDAGGGDPDSTSPTLRSYHLLLWSKALPNGQIFTLHTKQNKSVAYLYHNSALGEFFLGSDAITHSYKNQKSKDKQAIVSQIPTEVQALFDSGSTIGAYCIFPNTQINRKQTINQIRGMNPFIDDRFDLTLACIQRFYKGEQSPIYNDLLRYKSFFDLFGDFTGYVEFFFLQDLLDDKQEIKFYFPFDGFKTKPIIANIAAYLEYKARVEAFVKARTVRMVAYVNSKT
jgi:hypothetical protein